jgi:single-strand DNA-binding protein
MLIGNLTRDPELRYTPNGTAVATFGLATNRSWLPEGATERREETEFHRIVAWSKLADLCAQLLYKGVKVFVEGRLQTRSWVAQDGTQHTSTEVVIDDMIVLDKKGDRALRAEAQAAGGFAATGTVAPAVAPSASVVSTTATTGTAVVNDNKTDDDVVEKKQKDKKEDKEDKKESASTVDSTADKNENLNPEDIPF